MHPEIVILEHVNQTMLTLDLSGLTSGIYFPFKQRMEKKPLLKR